MAERGGSRNGIALGDERSGIAGTRTRGTGRGRQPAPPVLRAALVLLAASAAFAAGGLSWRCLLAGRQCRRRCASRSSLLPARTGRPRPFHRPRSSPCLRMASVWLSSWPRRGMSEIWVRLLDTIEARALAGTERASFPFWSPDSRFIAFFADGKLKKVDINGGRPQVLADAPAGRGGTWNQFGAIVFTPSPSAGLVQVSPTAARQRKSRRPKRLAESPITGHSSFPTVGA